MNVNNFTLNPQQRMYLVAISMFLLILFFASLVLPNVDFSSPLNNATGFLLTTITQSAGKPFFPITILLGVAIGFYHRKSFARWVTVCGQFMMLLLLAFILKFGLKAITEVPRPYTNLLVNAELIDSSDAFYQLSDQQQSLLIKNSSDIFGQWRTDNWLDGTNYAFPSGHTLFAAVFVAFWGGFLLQNKHYILASTLLLWGVSVALSRIYLAMHSYTDLFVACAFVVLFGLVIPILQKLLAPLERAIERLQHSSQLKNC